MRREDESLRSGSGGFGGSFSSISSSHLSAGSSWRGESDICGGQTREITGN